MAYTPFLAVSTDRNAAMLKALPQKSARMRYLLNT